MSSKSRGGLSKREYAAKAAGGSLNYKSGKISKPSKKSSSSRVSSGSSDFSKYTGMDWGSAAEAAKRAGLNTSTGSAFDLAMNKKYNPGNYSRLTGNDAIDDEGDFEKWTPTEGRAVDSTYSQAEKDYVKKNQSKLSSKVNTSQRSSAADYLRKGVGINTANAQGSHLVTPQVDKPTGILGSLFMKGVEPLRGIYANLTGGKNLPEMGWSEGLGLTEKVDGPFTYNMGTTPETDPTTGNVINPSNPENIVNNPAPYQSWETFNQSQGNPVTNRTDTRTVNRNSQPVSQPTPIFQPTSSNISSIFQPQSAPQDFSNNTQTNDNTMRQLLGRGYFSNGIASNGKGDYGIEGAMTGTNELDENNLLNELLGIKTAYAAESPQTMTSLFSQPSTDFLGRPYTGYSAQNGGQSTRFGTDIAPVFQQAEEEESAPSYTQPSMGNSGVAQQYAHPSQNPALQYQQEAISGYGKQQKDTEKAYKKALSEMLKGIESQYKTSEQTGTNELNKQKVNDLQQLASRFSFGLNQDPNSEQAIQYQQRTQNDYAGQLSDFLAKLAAAKTQDISQARSGNQGNLMQALQSIQSQKSSAQEKLANLMYQMQSGSKKSSTTSSKLSHNDIFSYVNDALANGGSWQEIADDAKAQGVPTETGSYFDQLMNQANKQNRWA